MMKKLMTKENGILLGVGVLAFIGVRYLLNKRNENQSNAVGDEGAKPCAMPSYQGVSCEDFCVNNGGTWHPETGSYGGCAGVSMGVYGGRKVRMLRTRSFSSADGGCGCAG